MKAYYVHYNLYSPGSSTHGIQIIANNKYDAYDKAIYEEIPKKHDGQMPYSAWVHSVTYNNGNYRIFNTFEGKPF